MPLHLETETKLDLNFISATIELPQVPITGAAGAGWIAMGDIREGRRYSGEQFGARDLTGRRLRAATAATAGVHHLLEIRALPGLQTAMRFAVDLVRSDVISTALAFGESDPVSQPTIELPTSAEVARFGALTHIDPSFVDAVFSYNAAAADALGQAGGPARQHTEAYMGTILEVSSHFDQADLPPEVKEAGRREAMDEARRDLSADLLPIVHEAVASALPNLDMTVTAQNMVRWEPGPALVDRHFGPPPAS